MNTFKDSQMRNLDRNKHSDSSTSFQHNFHQLGEPWATAKCDSCSRTPTTAVQNSPLTPPNNVQDTNGFFQPSHEDKEGLYKKKHHQNGSRVDTGKHGYNCSTQKPKKFKNDHLCHNADPTNGSVIHWSPGSLLPYFVSSANLAKDDGKLEMMKIAMQVATQDWQSTSMDIIFQETHVRKEATFVVLYDPDLDDATYAIAFLPGTDYRYIRIGNRMFKTEHVKHMSRVLCHEIGHVLGLRHNLWQERVENGTETGSARYFPTSEIDDDSIMNHENVYDLSLFVLSASDRTHIRDFYNLPAGSHNGLTITDCHPTPLPLAFHELEHLLRRTLEDYLGGAMMAPKPLCTCSSHIDNCRMGCRISSPSEVVTSSGCVCILMAQLSLLQRCVRGTSDTWMLDDGTRVQE
jgi:hypothetical protein